MASFDTATRTSVAAEIQASPAGDALRAALADDERLVYCFPTTSDVAGGDPPIASAEHTVVAATDRRVIFAWRTAGETTVESVAYTAVADVRARDDILRRHLTIAVRDDGEYRLRPRSGVDLAEVAASLARLSEAWDRVTALLDDVANHASTLERALGHGDRDAARSARREATALLGRAREVRHERGGDARAVLGERIDEATRDLHRARVRGHRAAAERVRREATDLARGSHHDAAHRTFRRARRELESGLVTALTWNLDGVETCRQRIAEIDVAIADLEARPLARGRAAERAATGADSPARALVAWEAALEHYRVALTACWGEPEADFDGETDALRGDVERAVEGLLSSRVAVADRLLAEGDECAFAADVPGAEDRYAVAAFHLERAAALASEFAAGDADALAERLAHVRETARGFRTKAPRRAGA